MMTINDQIENAVTKPIWPIAASAATKAAAQLARPAADEQAEPDHGRAVLGFGSLAPAPPHSVVTSPPFRLKRPLVRRAPNRAQRSVSLRSVRHLLGNSPGRADRGARIVQGDAGAWLVHG
jgi:hypothetical protein